jgi:hypothetical protein
MTATLASLAPLAPGSQALSDDFGGDTPITLVWGSGGRSGASIFRLPPTPEERLVQTISRGGYPLMRRETCADTKMILITGAKGRHRV